MAEDGDTFAANARLKAAGYARHLGQWVLADDSGLEVDALGSRPGVFSARYSGPDATDESNNRLLLEQLSGTPLEQRTARFVCHIAVADPSGEIRAESEAACRGRILFEPRGQRRLRLRPAVRDRRVPSHVRRVWAARQGPAEPPLPRRLRVIPQLMQLADSRRI